jgi:hypothetical protein
MSETVDSIVCELWAPLVDRSRDDLLVIARAEGVAIPDAATDAEIVAAIKAHRKRSA